MSRKNRVGAARRSGAALAILMIAVGCENPAEVHVHPQFGVVTQHTGTGQLPELAGSVRQATARYHSTVQAANAGYAVASECVAVPGLGGMGFHWVDMARVDPAFDPLVPEAVLYEPGPRGQLELVAVEYIVIDVGQPAPTFAGQPFDVGGTPVPVPHWSLHVWVHRDNPNGLFTPFNPDVVCP
jgi:hypothetical protein